MKGSRGSLFMQNIKMKPAISLLRKTLENVLDQQPFEVTPFFDFVISIGQKPSQQQSLTINEFLLKWESCLHDFSTKMIILKYAGTWTPNCATQSELRKQKRWMEFAQVYDSSFAQSDIDSQKSPDYQPLNFKDLLRLPFWREFYETFGEKIAAYIFEKCAILYEIEEGLHLMVANPRGGFFQKFKKYEGGKRKVQAPATKGPKYSPMTYQHLNPFKLNDVQNYETNEILVEKAEENNQAKRKPCKENLAVQEDPEPPIKKRKIGMQMEDDAAESKSTNVNGPRWIKPKPKDLENVIRYRQSYSNSSNRNPSSSSSTGNSLEAQLNYVAIYKDESFLPKDKGVVWKQNLTISPVNPKLPRQWEGLKLPDNLIELFVCHNQQIQIAVYNISETLAKKLDIRLKPKARCRKSKKNGNVGSCNEEIDEVPEASASNANSNGTNPVNIGGLVSMIQAVNIQRCVQLSEASSTQRIDENKIKPFSMSVKLPINSCLYNKSSWSKWPSKHCSSESVRLSQENVEKESVTALVSSILMKPICSERANEHLWNVISDKWTSADDESVVLNKIIHDIIAAHVKFKDMHKLQKNCLTHWQSLYTKRHEKKALELDPKCGGDNDPDKGALSQPTRSPEVIDLTESTPTTHMSSLSGPSVYETTPPNPDEPSLQKKQNENDIQESVGGHDRNLDHKDTKDRKSILTRKSKRVSISRHFLARKSSGECHAKSNSFGSLKRLIPHNCIMQTLKQIFHIMNLDALLGSRRNIRGFFKFVRKAVILGGTKSSLHLSEAMALIRPDETPFFQVCGGDPVATETFTAKLISWLFNDYILELLRMSFYITECGFTRLQLRFYLRESWTSASHKMKRRLCETGALNQITSNSSDPNKASAVLRFVPKSNHNLRSLVMMKKSAWKITQDDDKRFKLLLHYIDAKINKSRMYLPTGIMYEWRKFLNEWKAMDSPKLYYLRMDIRDAYPSVSTAKLKDILLDSIRGHGKRVVQKQFAIFKSNGRKLKRESVFDEGCPHNWHSGIHVRSCIVMDLDRDKALDVWNTLDQIVKLITSASVITLGKKTYEFTYGLPQGWGPSPILCSIYYGHIDSTLYKPYLETRGCLFLRVVDDYVFISPKANEVMNLIDLLKMGCQRHDIKINEEKTETNIFVKSNSVLPESSCEKITFCGWNLCITCGHVSRDYSKYKNQDYCSTVTFLVPDRVSSPEEFIRLRGTVIMPTRLKPILLDPAINCCIRILQTVFEASILLGFRFYAMCRVLYPSLNALKEKDRAENLVGSIRLCCSRMARHVNVNTENISSSLPSKDSIPSQCKDKCCGFGSSSSDTLSMSNEEFVLKSLSFFSLMYVSLYGFRLKLMRHSEVFRSHVLPEINKEIFKQRKKLGIDHCNRIIEIVGSKIPSHLDEILI